MGNRTWTLFAVVLWAGNLASESDAGIIPVWTTPDNSVVTLPASGSATYRLQGYVTPDFDAMLIMDNSGSMKNEIPANVPPARNGGRQRGDWALDGADDFIDGLADQVRLGLTKFAGTSELLSDVAELGPPNATPSHRAALKALLRTLDRQGNGTNIANAITFATDHLLNRPNPGDSLHLVLVTDGQPTVGDTRVATNNAIARGIDSVNTIALPGANPNVLRDIAERGHGVFVDGTDLTQLLPLIEKLVEDIETLERLDIELPDGTLLEDVAVGSEGFFAIDGLIQEGDNVFRAHATSNRGNVAVSELHVLGRPVPEPSALALLAITTGLAVACATRRSAMQRRAQAH